MAWIHYEYTNGPVFFSGLQLWYYYCGVFLACVLLRALVYGAVAVGSVYFYIRIINGFG